MKVLPTALSEVLLLEPRVFRDTRGWLFESFNRREFAAATGVDLEFVQDNHSYSTRNVLRGLHYQLRQPQGKLVRVIAGEIYDVAVDLRRSSRHFGCWIGTRMSARDHGMAWIPPGFAHGFLVLSEAAEVLYKVTDYYAPGHERCLLWNDPQLGIAWPLEGMPLLSAKDAAGASLAQAEVFP
jgi:dTDP-4-dehydrorhamnose 3,5-epimerase